MKIGYEVWGISYLATYTTRRKAERLVYEHPLLKLTIKEIKLPFLYWLWLKSIFL